MNRSALRRSYLVVLFVVTFIAFSGGSALAIPSSQAIFFEIDLGGGLWRYDYTLYNTSDSIADAGYDIYDFFLTFSPAVTLANILSPSDWTSLTDNASFIDWFSISSGEPPMGADIAPGASLNGFCFVSDTHLASLPFEVLLSDPAGGNPVPYDGTTTPGATSVPEPGTLLLLGNGLAGLGYFRGKRFLRP